MIQNNDSKKWELNYQMMYMWFWAESHEFHLSDYIKDMSYASIAIYGMGEIGTLLYRELSKAGIHIDFVIDKKENIFCKCRSYTLDDTIPVVDQVIITIEQDILGITEELESRNIPCISFQQILCDLTGFSL